MRNKLNTIFLMFIISAVCMFNLQNVNAEDARAAINNDIATIASNDTETTIEDYINLLSKQQFYNTELSSAYVDQSYASEYVDDNTGDLVLIQTDISVPIGDTTFNLNRIYNSGTSLGADEKIEFNNSNMTYGVVAYEPFYNTVYKLGNGWRYSFPTLDVSRTRTEDSGTNYVISNILYHSENGQVYSIGQANHNYGFEISNHSLNDVEIKFTDSGIPPLSDSDYRKIQKITIFHKNTGITYEFGGDGCLLKQTYKNGDNIEYIYPSENNKNVGRINLFKNGEKEPFANISFSYENNNFKNLYVNGATVSYNKGQSKSITYNYINSVTIRETDKEHHIWGDYPKNEEGKYVLTSVSDFNGNPKYEFYTARNNVTKSGMDFNFDFTSTSYTVNAIYYAHDNRMSVYNYQNQSRKYITGGIIECQKILSHQDYVYNGKHYDPSTEYGGGKVGPFTKYDIPDDFGYYYKTPENGIFVWNSNENTDIFNTATGTTRIIRIRAADASAGTTLKISGKNLSSKNLTDVYLYNMQPNDPLPKKVLTSPGESEMVYSITGYGDKSDYKIAIEGNWDAITKVEVNNVAKYAPNQNADVYIERFGSMSDFWQPPEGSIVGGRGFFDFKVGYMHSWKRHHSEIVSAKKDYEDYIIDTSIQFWEKDNVLTFGPDRYTSAGVMFGVKKMGTGNNNFDGYYVRISPPSDTGDNANTIALFKMNYVGDGTEDVGYTEIVKPVPFTKFDLNNSFNETKIYAMRVVVDDNNLKVYVCDLSSPVIDIPKSDGYDFTGGVGARTVQRRAAFSKFEVKKLDYSYTLSKTDTYSDGSKKTVKKTFDYLNNNVNEETITNDYNIIVQRSYDANRMPSEVNTYVHKLSEGNIVSTSLTCENYVYNNDGTLAEYRGPLAERFNTGSGTDGGGSSEQGLGPDVIKYTYDRTYCMPLSKTYLMSDGVIVEERNTLTADKKYILESTVSDGNTVIKRTKYSYDDNRLVKKAVMDGDTEAFVTTYKYGTDGTGDLSQQQKLFPVVVTEKLSDSQNRVTKYAYDSLSGSLLKVVDSNSNATTYKYDNLSRLETVTDEKENVIEYKYNTTYKEGDHTKYENEIIVIDRARYAKAYYYDSLGRITKLKASETSIKEN